MKKTSKSKIQTPKPQDLPVVITITVMPLKDGKRRVLVSGAPDGEMPVVKAGLFADLHRLLDETWIALLKRKPQVVKRPAPKQTAESKEQEAGVQEAEGAGQDTPQPPAELPAIEGDTEPGGEPMEDERG